tara:strand:- start:2671 stop:3363 length:693 start_codon:yes stop_codon:yes gene_type:complete
MKLPSVLLLLAATLGLSSCVHQVGYPLMQSDKVSGTKRGTTLRVELLRDLAPRDQRINVRVGSQHWRVTGREGYREGEIAGEVTRAVTKHLRHSGVFAQVLGPNQSGHADYVLSGSIADFNASGQVQPDAERALLIGSIASTPGAAAAGIATKNRRTQVSSVAHLKDLKIRDARTGQVVWSRQEIVKRSVEQNAHFLQADAAVLYRRADWELRRAVNEMAQDINRRFVAQ